MINSNELSIVAYMVFSISMVNIFIFDILVSILSGIALLIISIYLFYRSYQEKEIENKENKTKKDYKKFKKEYPQLLDEKGELKEVTF